jgi:hypothetical protein
MEKRPNKEDSKNTVKRKTLSTPKCPQNQKQKK